MKNMADVVRKNMADAASAAATSRRKARQRMQPRSMGHRRMLLRSMAQRRMLPPLSMSRRATPMLPT